MKDDPKKTDWSEYYRKPFFLAKFTRAILRKRLFKAISSHLPDRHAFDVAELGGGASCYMNMILHNFTVRKYHIFDNNADSLRVTAGLAGADYESAVRAHEVDLLNGSVPELECNIVFSGGLIEHFDEAGTAKIIREHFNAASRGGLVVLLFPVRSLSYRMTRKLAEICGKWIFHDERPLDEQEVIRTAAKYGKLVHRETIHSILLSQTMLVFVKNC